METTPMPNASVSVLKNSNDESVTPDANKAGAGSVSGNQTEDPPPEDIPSIDGKGSRGRKIDDESRVSVQNSTLHPPLDEERVDKAEAFLRNGDIRDVSDADKRAYLRSRAGMMPEEIDAAMERVARKGRIFDASDGDSRDRIRPRKGEDRDHGRSSRCYYEDQSRDRRGGIRSDPNERHRDDYGNARRPPPPNYPTANYNEVPTRMHPDPGTEREGAAPSPSFLPAWAGGFSLGIFCLAALRWLNGGDFVLFPPPTASESGTLGSAKEGLRSSENEGDTDESDSKQHEDDNLQGGDVEYDEFEGSDGDEGLGMILEGTANAQKFHPEETQPSLNELMLEIRALTSAVHSYRDEQERANRAVSAQVGKGMTDGAMEFLRQKKSDEVATCGDKATDLNEKVTSITLLLSEVSGDLSMLGQSILQDQGGDCKPVQPEESPDSAERPSKDGNKDGIPSKQKIEELMQKIQKVVDIVKSIDSTEKGGFGPRENESNDRLAIKKEIESRSVESTAAPVAIEPVADADASQQNENSPQHQRNSELQSNQVEDALKILSSNNEAKELEAGAQILYLYLLNISKNPSFPRHRKIYTNNNNFRSKIGNLTGARELLLAVGFVERAGFFEWAQPDDAETKSRLAFALVALEMMKSGAKSKDEAIVPPSDHIEIPTRSSGSLAHAAVSVSVEKALDLN